MVLWYDSAEDARRNNAQVSWAGRDAMCEQFGWTEDEQSAAFCFVLVIADGEDCHYVRHAIFPRNDARAFAKGGPLPLGYLRKSDARASMQQENTRLIATDLPEELCNAINEILPDGIEKDESDTANIARLRDEWRNALDRTIVDHCNKQDLSSSLSCAAMTVEEMFAFLAPLRKKAVRLFGGEARYRRAFEQTPYARARAEIVARAKERRDGIERNLARHFCARCDARLDRPKRCARCLKQSYCGVACQRADWPHHKETCVSKR